MILCKPVTQLLQTFCKGREASLLILCTPMGICNTDAGIDPGFVDIKATTIVFENFKRQSHNLLIFIVIRPTVTGHPAKSSRLWKR